MSEEVTNKQHLVLNSEEAATEALRALRLTRDTDDQQDTDDQHFSKKWGAATLALLLANKGLEGRLVVPSSFVASEPGYIFTEEDNTAMSHPDNLQIGTNEFTPNWHLLAYANRGNGAVRRAALGFLVHHNPELIDSGNVEENDIVGLRDFMGRVALGKIYDKVPTKVSLAIAKIAVKIVR